MSGRRAVGDEAGWALLARAPEVRVAGIVDGRPIVRSMHGVVVDGRLWLHGVPRGTVASLGGGPVQIQADEVVARIPSHFRDPERACPATTYYRSVLADGVATAETDPAVKAAVLQRMMEQRQPEGGHLPIDPAHPLYAAAVRGLGVWSVELRSLSAVEKLGQDQTAAHVRGILGGLWRRGGSGDLAAIEAISDAHPERPRFVELPSGVPEGLVPRCHPSDADVDAAAALAAPAYWNGGMSRDQLADAVRSSVAWVGLARDGVLVATARAISDRAKRSWVYDVVVADGLQRSGVGTALIGLLLDHPAVRGTEINLATRDAMAFYARFGFGEVFVDRSGAYPRTTMARPRPTVSPTLTAGR
ncbi:MAG: GNAT family N-acetyltransferase [Myxococcota bacterium]